ncbi:phage tail assembly chaperone [Erwinia sp. CGal63]|uniref:phage tail assembly chaperone n=1 Tax=Erwinia sp. CGal63 TaxID=2919889 RepID=UPI00300BCA57
MEFTIDEKSFRIAKLDVFQQLKVSRKLLPLLAGLLSEIQTVKSAAAAGDYFQVLEKALPAIAHSLAEMSEEDTNAILHPCLAVVSRQQAKSWVPIFSQGVLMFDDLDLITMLRLVLRVVEDSLGGFLPELPVSKHAAPTAD